MNCTFLIHMRDSPLPKPPYFRFIYLSAVNHEGRVVVLCVPHTCHFSPQEIKGKFSRITQKLSRLAKTNFRVVIGIEN